MPYQRSQRQRKQKRNKETHNNYHAPVIQEQLITAQKQIKKYKNDTHRLPPNPNPNMNEPPPNLPTPYHL